MTGCLQILLIGVVPSIGSSTNESAHRSSERKGRVRTYRTGSLYVFLWFLPHFLPRSICKIRSSLTSGPTASRLRKAGVFSRVDDSNATIGKRYSRNDELGTPFGITVDFACTFLFSSPDVRFPD
jgi:hypothetical protein